MNPEWKEKWITALRSGDYKQAKGKLCKVNRGNKSFCCLGVLCDIVDPESWVLSSDNTYASMYAKGGNLPNEIKFKTDFISDGRAYNLIVMNDRGESFSVIADYIEKEM